MMKKAIAITAAVVLVVVAVVAVIRYLSVDNADAAQGAARAASLQAKIDSVKQGNSGKAHSPVQMLEISEAELEAYVMVVLRDKIPFHVESMRVQLTPGIVSADTRLTIPGGGTGNPIVDAIVGGTHNLLVRGKLSGAKGKGQFVLEGVQVDRIPVPSILVDTLIKKYARPQFPDTDLKKPFVLPWGIQAIDIGEGKAIITY